jgi:hypothetical protein
MAEDRTRYDQYVDEALRGVARRVLHDVARDGLTGNHHFYISFRTAAPGVSIPDYLRSRYPEEITIVLQHQFWGLEIEDKQFSVTVSFNKQNERLTVPFAALTAFVDPSVRFGLQFEEAKREPAAERTGQDGATAAIPGPGARPTAIGRSAGAKLGAARDPAGAKDAAPPPGDSGKPDEAATADDATDKGNANKVVTLDAFRKK